MTEQSFKEALRAAVEDAIADVGMHVFKQTSMFRLSNRTMVVQQGKKVA